MLDFEQDEVQELVKFCKIIAFKYPYVDDNN